MAGAVGAAGGSAMAGTRGSGEGMTAPASLSTAVFAASEIRSVEPWEFSGHVGRVIWTDHFKIYTTEEHPAITDRVPKFVERAVSHYMVALTPDGALPPPGGRMESFIMGSRAQWKELTLQMLGKQGAELLNITAGGFATGGRAYLFDIGIGSTFFVASHEGWHQYSQRTFAEQMPIFMEEGAATYMEGHRWEGDSVRFLPWANIERFEQLRTTMQNGKLLTLRDLIENSPQQLIKLPGDSAVSYYAQLWALMHFLAEGEGGAYRPALQRLLRDAQAGRMSQTVSSQMSVGDRAGMLGKRQSAAVFRTYFDRDIDGFNARYQQFITQVVRTGARDYISQGLSPVQKAQGGESRGGSVIAGTGAEGASGVSGVLGSPSSPLVGDRVVVPKRGVRSAATMGYNGK